jgi:carbon-monoxide dehydrogenase small subunit
MDVPAGERIPLSLTVNGVQHDVEVEPRRLLSDVLRHDVGLTGTHVGCEHGVCGCCTVLLDGAPARSCLILAVQAAGHRTARCRRCSRRSSSTTACSAASARPAF